MSAAPASRSVLSRLWPVLLLLPLVLPRAIDNGYYVGLLNRILVYAILVASLDLVVGYIGDVSIGHAGLFAIGAYTVAVLTASPNLNTESSIAHFYQLPFGEWRWSRRCCSPPSPGSCWGFRRCDRAARTWR